MNTEAYNKLIARLDKYKYGLFVMLIFFVASLTIRVQYGFVERPDISHLLHRKEDDVIELHLEPPELVEQRMLFDGQQVQNTTRDENSTQSSPPVSFYGKQSLSEVENSVYELEKTLFAQAGGSQIRASIQQETEQQKKRQKQELQEVNTKLNQPNQPNSAGNATQGNVMVSYNLKDRTAQYAPPPGYMCPQGTKGQITVRIKVDAQGKVLEAKITSTSQTSECMREYALNFAKKAKFNYINTAGTQDGTITYTFVD